MNNVIFPYVCHEKWHRLWDLSLSKVLASRCKRALAAFERPLGLQLPGWIIHLKDTTRNPKSKLIYVDTTYNIVGQQDSCLKADASMGLYSN